MKFETKIKITFAFVILTLAAVFGKKVTAQVRPRFEMVLKENPGDNSQIGRFEVWHDKETGQEFICATSFRVHATGISCFKTGREWK